MQEEGYFGPPQWVIVNRVCPGVEIFRAGYGHHGEEDVFYQTDRHGFLRDHFVTDVRDAEVFRY